MNGFDPFPGEIFKVLRSKPDQVFTLDELGAKLGVDTTVPDMRNKIVTCAGRLHDKGKIELRIPAPDGGEGFGYVWPAPIETDHITGRKFKWTAEGRRWVT